MIEKPRPPTPGKYREIRTRGREVDVPYLYLMCLLDIKDKAGKDLLNNPSEFNSYEGTVENLISMVAPYYDLWFYSDYTILSELPVETLDDKIDLLRDKVRVTSKLLKRKAFLPADDVATEADAIIDYLKKRVKGELDTLIAVEGERGTGKSYSVLWLAKQIDDTFTLDRVFFSEEEFRDMLNKKKYPHGTVFVWDEAGAGEGMSRREAMTPENIEFNKLLQTIRSRRYIVFFTVPYLEDLDSGSVKYFGAKIQPIQILRTKGICLIKFQEKKRGSAGKPFWPYLRTPTGERITTIPIPKIADTIAEKYEKKKDAFVDKLIRKRRKKSRTVDVIRIAEELTPEIDQLKGPRGGISIAEIQVAYKRLHPKADDLGRGYADQIRRILQRHENEKKKPLTEELKEEELNT